eukprot:gene15587-21685_t
MLHSYKVQAFPSGRPVRPPKPPTEQIINLWAEADRLKARSQAGLFAKTGDNVKFAFSKEGRAQANANGWKCWGTKQTNVTEPLALAPGAGISPETLGRPGYEMHPLQNPGMPMPPPPAIPMPTTFQQQVSYQGPQGPVADPLYDDGTGPNEPEGPKKWYETTNPFEGMNYKWNRINGITNANPGAQQPGQIPAQQAVPMPFGPGGPQAGFIPGQQQPFMPPMFVPGLTPIPGQQFPFAPGQQQFVPGQQPYGPGQQQFGPGQQPFGPGQQQFGPGQQPFRPGQQQFGPGQQPGQQQFGLAPGQQPGQQQFGPGQPQFGPGQQQPGQQQFGLSAALSQSTPGYRPPYPGQQLPPPNGLIPVFYPGGRTQAPPGAPNPYLPNQGPPLSASQQFGPGQQSGQQQFGPGQLGQAPGSGYPLAASGGAAGLRPPQGQQPGGLVGLNTQQPLSRTRSLAGPQTQAYGPQQPNPAQSLAALQTQGGLAQAQQLQGQGQLQQRGGGLVQQQGPLQPQGQQQGGGLAQPQGQQPQQGIQGQQLQRGNQGVLQQPQFQQGAQSVLQQQQLPTLTGTAGSFTAAAAGPLPKQQPALQLKQVQQLQQAATQQLDSGGIGSPIGSSIPPSRQTSTSASAGGVAPPVLPTTLGGESSGDIDEDVVPIFSGRQPSIGSSRPTTKARPGSASRPSTFYWELQTHHQSKARVGSKDQWLWPSPKTLIPGEELLHPGYCNPATTPHVFDCQELDQRQSSYYTQLTATQLHPIKILFAKGLANTKAWMSVLLYIEYGSGHPPRPSSLVKSCYIQVTATQLQPLTCLIAKSLANAKAYAVLLYIECGSVSYCASEFELAYVLHAYAVNFCASEFELAHVLHAYAVNYCASEFELAHVLHAYAVNYCASEFELAHVLHALKLAHLLHAYAVNYCTSEFESAHVLHALKLAHMLRAYAVSYCTSEFELAHVLHALKLAHVLRAYAVSCCTSEFELAHVLHALKLAHMLRAYAVSYCTSEFELAHVLHALKLAHGKKRSQFVNCHVSNTSQLYYVWK